MKKLHWCIGLFLVGVFIYFVVYQASNSKNSTSLVDEFMNNNLDIPAATFPNYATSPYTTDAIYQRFERGYMLWRADKHCAYALRTDAPDDVIIPDLVKTRTLAHDKSAMLRYLYCLVDLIVPDQPPIAITPAEGTSLPVGVLGKLWKFYPDIREKLGFATKSEQKNMATVPANSGQFMMDGGYFADNQNTLPDGHILACGARAAGSGSCG